MIAFRTIVTGATIAIAGLGIAALGGPRAQRYRVRPWPRPRTVVENGVVATVFDGQNRMKLSVTSPAPGTVRINATGSGGGPPIDHWIWWRIWIEQLHVADPDPIVYDRMDDAPDQLIPVHR